MSIIDGVIATYPLSELTSYTIYDPNQTWSKQLMNLKIFVDIVISICSFD